MDKNPDSLSLDEIELVEKSSLRSLWLAARDFGKDAAEYFAQSQDDPKDIAEDITREMLDRFGGYLVPQRVYGNVDYRKARYVIHPEMAVKQAYFVDSKAEKSFSTATLQMSQLSMTVRQVRDVNDTDHPGLIRPIEQYGDGAYLATTLLAHFCYRSAEGNDGKDRPPYALERITLAAIPNGLLQDRYNPNSADSIWLAGRNAPSRGEQFRVRLSFAKLKAKSSWRVQELIFNETSGLTAQWSE